MAVVAGWLWAEGSPGRPAGRRGSLVALAANLGNLLDRAPGRAGKVSLIVFVVLAVTSRLAPELTGPALVAGAGAGMLWPDLRERCMLGDTGANVLGAGVRARPGGHDRPRRVVGGRRGRWPRSTWSASVSASAA